jgi:hypothetical protein
MKEAVTALEQEGDPVSWMVMGAATAAVADTLLKQAGPAARAAAGVAEAAEQLQQQQQQGEAGGPPPAAAAAAAAAGGVVLSSSQKALLVMARALHSDARVAMADAAVLLAVAQLKRTARPGSNMQPWQLQRQQDMLKAALAAMRAAAVPAAGSNALLLGSGCSEGELAAARQSILALAAAVAPAAAAVVSAAGAPMPLSFAGEEGFVMLSDFE